MKKQSPSVTTLIQKTWQIFEDIKRIREYVDIRNKALLTVSFRHDSARNLIDIKWSDQYYGADDTQGIVHVYTYEITSKGIHFKTYEELDPTKTYWQASVKSWSVNGDSTLTLMQVPNSPCPNFPKETMYLYHQRLIKETLSALPAWAIVCVNY